MEYCPIYLGREQVGTLTCRWEQRGIRAEADCPFAPGWIYRLVLETDRGQRRLGVMLPEQDRFRLYSPMPDGARPRRGDIDRSRPGEEHLPGLPLALSAFGPLEEDSGLWKECGDPAGALRQAWWKDTCFFLYTIPPDRPCPFVPLFCLSTLVEQEGRTYGVFCKKYGQYLPLSDSLFNGSVVS